MQNSRFPRDGLAKVQAELGVIPDGAAAEIRRKSNYDLDAMKREMDRTSRPIVPLLRAIKDVCEGDAGEYVHWGATTQDIMDTGTVLQIRRGPGRDRAQSSKDDQATADLMAATIKSRPSLALSRLLTTARLR